MGNCIFLQDSLSKYHKRLYKIPRHVCVEVNLTLFLGKCKELFDQQAKAPDHF